MKEKVCGNCKYFKDEDALGFGYCEFHESDRFVSYLCDNHEDAPIVINGWQLITKDNADEVAKTPPERLIIAIIHKGKPEYMEYREMFYKPHDLAELGGYYYYVLPELKIERNEQADTN